MRSIKGTISFSVLLLGLLLIALDKSRNEQLLVQRGMARMEREAQVTGMRLSGVMQYLFRNDQRRVADLEMSYAAVSQDLSLGLVCDEADVVRFASRLQWRGQKLADTPLTSAVSAAARSRALMEGITEWDGHREHLLAVFPFFTGYGLTSRGVVVLAYDSSLALDRARADALQESLVRACLLAATCLMLWLTLDLLVARRVREVLAYTQAIKVGQDLLPPGGKDELAAIAQGFAEAVEQLHETEDRLMESSEAERRRIGRDIHDDVCQRISAAQLKSGVLSHLLAREASSHSILAEEVARELQDASAITRGFAHGLAPVGVEREGLSAALSELRDQVVRTYGVACEIAYDVTHEPLAVWVQTHVFRIIQELVVNAAKHAKPTRIEARVTLVDRMLRIEVENDGAPFLMKHETEKGLGMQFLRQRARALGGHLEFRPRPDAAAGTLALCETRLEDIHFTHPPAKVP
ncbi:MAG: histidine kinase [Verrucomicrobiota bacterium]